MPGSDLCEYSDAYIVVKGDITITKTANRNFIGVRNRFLAFQKKHHLLTGYQGSIIY